MSTAHSERTHHMQFLTNILMDVGYSIKHHGTETAKEQLQAVERELSREIQLYRLGK